MLGWVVMVWLYSTTLVGYFPILVMRDIQRDLLGWAVYLMTFGTSEESERVYDMYVMEVVVGFFRVCCWTSLC